MESYLGLVLLFVACLFVCLFFCSGLPVFLRACGVRRGGDGRAWPAQCVRAERDGFGKRAGEAPARIWKGAAMVQNRLSVGTRDGMYSMYRTTTGRFETFGFIYACMQR